LIIWINGDWLDFVMRAECVFCEGGWRPVLAVRLDNSVFTALMVSDVIRPDAGYQML
jgi:hypothetical protein